MDEIIDLDAVRKERALASKFSYAAMDQASSAAAKLIGQGYASSAVWLTTDIGDEFLSIQGPPDGWAIYSVGRQRDGTYYLCDGRGWLVAESHDLGVVLDALSRRKIAQGEPAAG